MELTVGDLVRHNVHGWWGIVLTKTDRWGSCSVCRVEWCESRKSHLIDINFLDKVNE